MTISALLHEWQLLLWLLVCIAGVLLLGLQMRKWNGNRRRGNCFKAVLRGEDGAAYSMSIVLTSPLFIGMVAVILQLALLLVIKLGTIQAAFSATRTAIVWAGDERMEEKVLQAARNSMTPFGASTEGLLDKVQNISIDANENATNVLQAYRALTGDSGIADGAVIRKYRYSHIATSVEIQRLGSKADSDIKVTVHYEAPLRVAIASRFLGGAAPFGAPIRTHRISTSFVLSMEAALSRSQKLGIDYDPDH